MPQEDEILPAEEQPLPAAASPTAYSPGYVPEFDSEKEPKEDDKDPEEDPTDYPTDREDDDDDDKDEDEDEEEEEEKEHPAPADSVPPVHHMTARISIRDEPSISLHPREKKRVRFASPTPSHEVGESSAAGAARQDGPAVAREDPYSVARGDLYGFIDMVDVAPGHPMSRELDYGITDTWDDLVGAIDEIAPTTLEGVNQRVTDLSTIVEQETTIMYGIMEDARDDREREAKMAREAWGLSMDASDYARSDVMSLRTTVVAQSALISELQSADHRRQRVISELLASDHKRQVQLTKTLSLLSIMGYSQLADCIDLLFCLATQYRSFVQKMAPKRRTTRLNPSATPTPVTDTHTTTSVTNAQIQAMINEGVTAALAARDATWNGDDSHTSGTGVRRPMQVARECTYSDFLKCQSLNFKGTEGVVGLT
ncbi:hypothetical protein Tco_0013064 [Tanacetum coccineum]